MQINKSKFHGGSWLLTILLVAIAAVHIICVFYPGHRATALLRKEIEYKQHYISESEKVSAVLAASQTDLAELMAYIEHWQKEASSVHRLPVLYGDINKLSNQSGTTTMRFEPQMIVELNRVRQIPINMACKGSFAHIYEFIRSLESLSKTIWVEKLRFDKAGQTGENVLCELNLVIFSDNLKNSNYIDIIN